MDILRMVVKKRSEDKQQTDDKDSLGRFATRVAKLRGDGPMATSEEPEVALEVVSINIKEIEIPANYPRKFLGDLDPLIASIRVFGIQQPLKVVKLKGSKKYRLVFGRRRLKAAEAAGMDAVPCIVELSTKEDRLQVLSLLENRHRSGLNPIEEGAVFQQLLAQNTTKVEELSKQLGLVQEEIHELVDLLNLPSTSHKDIINRPEIFTFAMLKVLLSAFRASKPNGKKLMNAIAADEVASPAQAKSFISKL